MMGASVIVDKQAMATGMRDPGQDPAASDPAASEAAGGRPDVFTAASGRATPLVFASPHSGFLYPADMGARAGLPLNSLRSAEDALVDQLTASGPSHGAPLVAGRIGRAYIDLNRSPDELDPSLIEGLEIERVSPKTAAGYGVAPRLTGDGLAIYDRRLSLDEVRQRIEHYHRPYHQALADQMRAARQAFGVAILIDWHSMPARVSSGAAGPDVILGDRHGATCGAELTRFLKMQFQGLGWRVGLNTPYAGGYSTQLWGRPDEGFQAIQIELNRALYLDEAALTPNAGYQRCQKGVARVIAALCERDWSV